MSPTQEYQRGRVPEALMRWSADLAEGRSWRDVEAEIIACCEGRIDQLTGLLLAAESVCDRAQAAMTQASGTCPERHAAVAARHPHWSSPDRVPLDASTMGPWY
jgi:hypothetical protein